LIARDGFLRAAAAALGVTLMPGASRGADLPTPDPDSPSATVQHLSDLRFGEAPTIPAAPGIDPALDASALLAPGTVSPAPAPIPGRLLLYAEASGRRHVLRIPDRWNGSLVVAGTPGTRSEFANDGIWSDFALARGYAFASSNKGIPYNAVVEPLAAAASHGVAYPIPFDVDGLESKQMAIRSGALTPQRIGIASWNQDFRHLIEFAQLTLRVERGKLPTRTYAVGLSNGGAQVRSALEAFPELLDGGVEYAAPRWTPERSLLDLLPPFLQAMPTYVESGFTDPNAIRLIQEAGFPEDSRQNDPAHPSLWCEYYSNAAPFYNDLTLFVYALLIDPLATAVLGADGMTPNPRNARLLPGSTSGSGLVQPALRAGYTPSSSARDAIVAFTQTGAIERPLISVAGSKDMLVPPGFHAVGYAKSVADAGHAKLHRLYLVSGGTHFDSLAGAGYGLQPQLPFAWAAFERLVRTVEQGDVTDLGTTRTVSAPSDIE
jgi:hypothetical protein